MRINGDTSINELMHGLNTNITAKEAHEIFNASHKKLVTLSCYEFDSCFVFQAVPERYANTDEADKVFDSLYFVSKDDGEVGVFKPFDIPADEYNRGKRITNFK